MAAVLKPDISHQRRRSRRSTKSTDRLKPSPAPDARIPDSRTQRSRLRESGFAPTAVNAQVVKALPQQAPPPWLQLLIKVQRTSSVLVFLLISATLAVYGWTVYVQQRWGQEYRQFETLQKHERQLIAGNEALKDQMAQQAEAPGSGLLVPDPSTAIFLVPASPRPLREPEHSSPAPENPATRPLGY
ncbi:MAG: hypothetical protein Kow00121_05060 [Elainellaceae cyanobacterium]